MGKKPLIAITMGDPAGIGPEIIAKVFDSGEIFPHCLPVVVGDAGVMKKIIEQLNFSVTVHVIAAPSDADPVRGRMDVIDMKNVDIAKHAWGGRISLRVRRSWNTSRRPQSSPWTMTLTPS